MPDPKAAAARLTNQIQALLRALPDDTPPEAALMALSAVLGSTIAMLHDDEQPRALEWVTRMIAARSAGSGSVN